MQCFSGLGLAINLHKTLLKFPSNNPAGVSNTEEIMLPAVVRPIPGKEIHVFKSLRQELASKELADPN